MKTYKIASIPGDGIGQEVIPAAWKVLDQLAMQFGFDWDVSHYPYACSYYLEHGQMMADDGLDRLRDHDAIFLGAVGYPGVPDHISLWGLLIPIRRSFEQYVNLRPVRLLPGISSPLKDPGKIDFIIVRENSEGEYSEVGGRHRLGKPDEVVIQQSTFSRTGVDRIMKFAFELAEQRDCKVTSATKSNGIIHTMPFWDERFQAYAEKYPGVDVDQYHIDILTAHFVTRPQSFDVVVASNLFGDILSDLGPAIVGGMGIAPGANINPEKKYPSMFEPVHGSAPDIAGKNIANPIASLWTAVMMLEHLGEVDAAGALMSVIQKLILDGTVLTPDLGGTSTTIEVAQHAVTLLKVL